VEGTTVTATTRPRAVKGAGEHRPNQLSPGTSRQLP